MSSERYLVGDPEHDTLLSINSERGHSCRVFPSLVAENDERGLLTSRALPVAYYSVDAHPPYPLVSLPDSTMAHP